MTPNIVGEEAAPRAQIIIGDSRQLPEFAPESVHLVVTSPPYWQIKDYEAAGQVGHGQTLHHYLQDLYLVWTECFRVLQKGRRLCINIGDQFARQSTYGRYKVIPLHAEIISQCEAIGFDYMGSIIWQKKTTMETSGGAVIMGSYPYPPNGIVEIDYEYILIFKKPGGSAKVSLPTKETSRLTLQEWKEYFSGHWRIGGTRQHGHEAMFPDELPRRLIKMFSFAGETVLDPFLGSGTTLKVALDLHRKGIGCEINPDFLPLIRGKLETTKAASDDIRIVHRAVIPAPPAIDTYTPRIQDAKLQDPDGAPSRPIEPLYKVAEVMDARTIRVHNGAVVRFLGLRTEQPDETVAYLKRSVLGKQVYLRFSEAEPSHPSGEAEDDVLEAYVYLKNRIFINGYLLRAGLASVDPRVDHRLKTKFLADQQKFVRDPEKPPRV